MQNNVYIISNFGVIKFGKVNTDESIMLHKYENPSLTLSDLKKIQAKHVNENVLMILKKLIKPFKVEVRVVNCMFFLFLFSSNKGKK